LQYFYKLNRVFIKSLFSCNDERAHSLKVSGQHSLQYKQEDWEKTFNQSTLFLQEVRKKKTSKLFFGVENYYKLILTEITFFYRSHNYKWIGKQWKYSWNILQKNFSTFFTPRIQTPDYEVVSRMCYRGPTHLTKMFWVKIWLVYITAKKLTLSWDLWWS
jgi:hypothetical protein